MAREASPALTAVLKAGMNLGGRCPDSQRGAVAAMSARTWLAAAEAKPASS